MVGDHDPVGAEAHRIPRILRIEDPLDHHRAVPEFADPLKVFPGNGRIEVVGQPANVVLKSGRLTQIGGNIAEVMRAAV